MKALPAVALAGALTVKCVAAASTFKVADAAVPAAASFDVNVLVVSTIDPCAVACARNTTVHESPAGSVLAVKENPPALKLPIPPLVPPGLPAGLRAKVVPQVLLPI